MDLTELDLLFGKFEDEEKIDDDKFLKTVEEMDRQMEERQKESVRGWYSPDIPEGGRNDHRDNIGIHSAENNRN